MPTDGRNFGGIGGRRSSGGYSRGHPLYEHEAHMARALKKKFPPAARRKRVSPRAPVMNPRTGGYMGIELKFYDTFRTGHNVQNSSSAAGGEANPGSAVQLNTVAQGDGESNRDGREITMFSILVRCVLLYPTIPNLTTLIEYGDLFCCIVLDTQTNGVLLDSEKVFKNTNSNGIVAATPLRNMQYLKRFKILASKKLHPNMPFVAYDGTNMEVGGSITSFDLFANLKGLRTSYTGTTADIANITDNSLSVIVFSNSVEGTPQLSYQARLRYRG